MNITNEMLQAAMTKAIEAGLLPRNACRENLPTHQELIRFILKAALDVAPVARSVARQRVLCDGPTSFVRHASGSCVANVRDTRMDAEYALR